jgi:hypothetical protein
MKWEEQGYDYCSEDNLKTLQNILSALENNFEVEYCKISNMPNKVMT